MKVAWKELTYQPKKYILIEFLIVLMIFMVVFLTGLTNGLGRAVSAQIENYGQVHYLLSEDAEDIISFSHFSDQSLQEIQDLPENQLAGLAIQRAGLKKTAKSETIDVTYFVVEDSALVNPKVVSGHSLSTDSGQIVLDQSFKSHGIKLGDKILDSNSKKSLKVIGFAKDAMYGHSAIAFMRPSTYQEIKKDSMPGFKWQAQAFVTKKKVTKKELPKEVSQLGQNALIQKIPGYQAEHLTLTMITWVLLLASSAILGVFFYILTLQKLKQFGVLKAIGMSMRQISGIQMAQISLLSLFGVAFGVLAAWGLSQGLPASMAFFLKWDHVAFVSASFIMISMLCGALSLIKVSKVDPLDVIGGNGE
ncbi:ABC transporter permease [Streptococcus penaeicida]|uniref:Putative hemin transport system permease protein HrtB n=1 Tax=Streptococcus penaeicida TaxID=1765960 RepID=A0A2N8LAR3_9STRE|nr:ABC transporter permease [Streptococcus penaeicida]PND47242.1 ABC transporter permease [Streptococcus penaeicida]